ncbi:MAG TPA: APC family permease [Candidatus Dormibacteraeota bacterium]|nr:APC family permease [Candidatus Dormibacteraeota bacterium]
MIASGAARPRRRIKVRGGTLGWFLCWAVVFADIGTSIYYTPGILFPRFGDRSALFVSMTLVVFVLLSMKYAEVAWRYPEGGGVVNVAASALHPFAGLLGGLFILIDYYLTSALSALSGLIYLSVVVPRLAPLVVGATTAALVALGILNLLGVRDSARVSATVAVLAAVGQLGVVLATAIRLGPAGILGSFAALAHGPHLTPVTLVTGYAAAFLAFSGLETIAQLAPAMREVRRRVAARAMAAVVATMAVTSPLLTLWSTTRLPAGTDPNQFISRLGAHEAGPPLGAYVAITAAFLLVFASNTAIIGAYHVFVALCRMGFLPRALERRNRWRGTPHWAILLAVGLPVLLVALSQGDVTLLGDLYAFGLLGAFILTSLSLDVVRWHDREWRRRRGAGLSFSVGVATTLLVAVAWITNLAAKPLATRFGGGLTLLGLAIGLLTYNYLRGRQPVVFPLLHRPHVPVLAVSGARRLPPARVLALLPHDPELAEAVVATAVTAAGDGPLAFLYRGDPARTRRPGRHLLEVQDPYLADPAAQVAFARAERASRRRVRDRRYIYVPGDLRREAIGDVWRQLHPRETILVEDDHKLLPPVALDRVRRVSVDGLSVLRLLSAEPPASGVGR